MSMTITTPETPWTSSIPATMAAVVCYGPGDYRLETVPVPQPGPLEVLTSVEAVGICAGDIKTYHGAPSFWGDAEQPRYVKPPMIPGHEFIGRVVALGEGAGDKHKINVGDRVISEQIVPCWHCRFCNHGQYWMCQKHDLYGFQNNVNGAMAEYMIYTKEAIVHKVPDSVPIEEAILVEPLACSLHAVERAAVEPDDIVVVAGAGTLGLGVLGALLGPYTYPRAIRYIADRTIDVRGIVTHQFPLADFAKGFETMERGEDSLKIVLLPGAR